MRSTDQGGLFFEKAFTITITDLNEAPTNIALSATSIAENVAAASTVGSFSTTDPDAANTFTYSLVSGTGSTDNASFTITSNALSINASPDFETRSSYSIRVRSTDQGGLFFEKAFTIAITDVNEAPTNIALSASSIAENVAAHSTVGSFSTTDSDAANTFTYTLVTGTGSADNASFTIMGNDLSINASPDFEAKSSYSIRVRSTDQGGLFFEKAFTVTITDVNEAPTITSSATVSVSENTTAVTTVTATDVDAGQTKAFTITGGLDAAKFSITSAGALSFVAPPNYEIPGNVTGDNVYEVTVTVTDDGTPNLSASQTLLVTVTDANDAPIITSDGGLATAAISIAENTTAVTTVQATDADVPAQTLSYSISGDDAAKFHIDSSSGVLTFITAPNFEAPTDLDHNNVYQVTVTVTDSGSGSLTDSQALFVTVTDANDAPTAISLSSTTVSEYAGVGAVVGTFSATDGDAAQSHSFALIAGPGGTDNGSFAIVGDTLQTAENFDFETKSSYSIRVLTTDNGSPSLSFAQVFTITIGDVDISVRDPDNRILVSGSSTDYFFPNPVVLGAASTPRVFTISNPGTAPLSSITVSMNGIQSGSFTLDTSATATTLAPGASTTFTIAFSPTYFGDRHATILVASNDVEKNPFYLGVSGTGTTITASLVSGTLNISDSITRADTLYLSTTGANLLLYASGGIASNAGVGSGTGSVTIPLSSITNGIAVNSGANGAVISIGDMTGFSGSLSVAPTVSGGLSINVTGPVRVGNHAVSLTANKAFTVSGDIQATGAGTINLSGAQGITVTGGAVVCVENGNLTLSGNQASLPAAGNVTGITLTGSCQVKSTGTGNVTLRGRSGSTTGRGVFMTGASIVTGGSGGSVSIEGVAVGTGASCTGLYISGTGTSITTLGADIALNGVGAGSTTGNYGTLITTGARVVATGAANLSITGVGGVSGQGVRIRDDGDATTISVVDGDLTITGREGSGSGSNQGFHFFGGKGGRIESTGSGDISLVTDSVEMTGVITSTVSTRGTIRTTGTGALTIKPFTPSASIGLGGGAGSLNLTETVLAYFVHGFSSITIGDTVSGSGEVMIGSARFTDPLVLAGGVFHTAVGTNISLNAGDSVTFKGIVAPGTSPGILTVDGKIILAANTTASMEIGGVLSGSQNDKIIASEAVDIQSGVTLDLIQTGGYVPTGTETFTLIARSGGTGTFAGKPEGYVYANFFGSGQPATLTYTGGTSGHDVVLLMGAHVPDIKIEQPVGTKLVDGLGSIAMGKAAVSKSSFTKTFTITNTGTGALTGLALNLTGANASDFTFTSPGSTALAEGASTTLGVTMVPTGLGTRTAILHIASNVNGSQNPFDIALTGTGIAAEIVKPILVVATPAAASKISEGAVNVTGTVADTSGIARLEAQFGSGAWFDILPSLNSTGTSGTFNSPITPTPGSNVLNFRLTDTCGNVTTLARPFTYVVLRPLTLATAGTGSGTAVISAPAGVIAASLQVASVYTVKATPAAGSFFGGWSSPNSSITLTNPSSVTQSFTMVPNAQLTATFVANPFVSTSIGTFKGLITAAVGTAPSKSNTGLFSAVLTTAGTFSGSVVLDGVTKPCSGTINPATGSATVIISNGATNWTLALSFGTGSGAPRITGTLTQVTGGSPGDVSNIAAERSVFSIASPVPVAKRGTYTVAFPAKASQSNASIGYPKGDGVGKMTIDAVGNVTLSGNLADGTPLLQTCVLSNAYTLPIYISLAGNSGALSGTAIVDESVVDSDVSAANLTWFLSPSISTYYPSGWPSGILVSMIGAHYAVPASSAVLPGLGLTNVTLGNADLTFTGGLLSAAQTKHVNITIANIATKAPTTDASFTFALAKATGTFSGIFYHTSGTAASYQGVVLQKGATAGGYGYFLFGPTSGGIGRARLLPR